MIDFIGGLHVVLRRNLNNGLTLTLLDGGTTVDLTASEWHDLVVLVMAVRAAIDQMEAIKA